MACTTALQLLGQIATRPGLDRMHSTLSNWNTALTQSCSTLPKFWFWVQSAMESPQSVKKGTTSLQELPTEIKQEILDYLP
jgi:hypothetical protein